MEIVPGRNPQHWAAFNSRFRLLLSPIVSTLCFLVVVFGSVYGMKKMLEPQFPGIGLAAAVVIAFVVQRLNGVSVHFSTRMIASLFIPRSEKRQLENQRVAGVDIVIGLLCLFLTAGICTVDFIVNREGNHEAVEMMTEKPQEKTVDTKPHEKVLALAEKARDAEKAAENRERAAWNSKVDAEINAEKRRLEARKRHLASVSATWAQNEIRQISASLKGLESRRRERKAEFIPKTSNLAEKEKVLADIAAQQSTLLLGQQAHVDKANNQALGEYEQRKQSRKSGMFLIYMAGMFLWHLCHGLKQYRALKFDEKHPDKASPMIEIFKTIGNGLDNALWTVRARIYDWLPEDEIQDAAKKDLLSKVQTEVCRDVFAFVSANQGVNEMAIYMAMKRHELDGVRQALRVLKTAKLLFENSGLWTADKNQAQFFFDQSRSALSSPEHYYSKGAENQGLSSIFVVNEAFVRALIDDLLTARSYVQDKAPIDQLIQELESTIKFV
ncbi:MAG: hypothetical protein R3D58_06935 [Saprospiraceae bacterium]|nr:hypothetical protein [Lewinellaceae bacterium]